MSVRAWVAEWLLAIAAKVEGDRPVCTHPDEWVTRVPRRGGPDRYQCSICGHWVAAGKGTIHGF